MTQEQPFDPRIGKHGEYAPTVCAATGQAVNGRHNTAVNLTGLYYFRVLEKANVDRQALRLTLLELVPKPVRQRAKGGKPDDE